MRLTENFDHAKIASPEQSGLAQRTQIEEVSRSRG